MWLCTKYGFFSLVCARKDKDDYASAPDFSLIMIRARNRDHLANLQKAFPGIFVDTEIIENTHTDYPFRILLKREKIAELMAGLLDDLVYTNFKSEAERNMPEDREYIDFLHSTWHAGLSLSN